MADTDKTTRKVKRDTEKDAGLDIVTVAKWAKSNPWVLAVIAGGGGIGGEQLGALIGQPIAAWHVALAVGGFALLDIFSRMLRRLDTIEERLAEGTDMMERHDKTLGELLAWRENSERERSGRNGAA